jgi:hypothetical protein
LRCEALRAKALVPTLSEAGPRLKFRVSSVARPLGRNQIWPNRKISATNIGTCELRDPECSDENPWTRVRTITMRLRYLNLNSRIFDCVCNLTAEVDCPEADSCKDNVEGCVKINENVRASIGDCGNNCCRSMSVTNLTSNCILPSDVPDSIVGKSV